MIETKPQCVYIVREVFVVKVKQIHIKIGKFTRESKAQTHVHIHTRAHSCCKIGARDNKVHGNVIGANEIL